MKDTARFESADLLSLTRPVLGAFIFFELGRTPESWLVLPATALACATDYVDGQVARRAGAPRLSGRAIDNVCDALFLAFAFAAYASQSVWSDARFGSATRYWAEANWLPLYALCASFGLYAIRLRMEAGRGLDPGRSPRGHTAGIANYALAIVGALAVLPGVTITPWLLEPAFVTVALLNASAVGENLLLMLIMVAPGRGPKA